MVGPTKFAGLAVISTDRGIPLGTLLSCQGMSPSKKPSHTEGQDPAEEQSQTEEIRWGRYDIARPGDSPMGHTPSPGDYLG